uniref:Retrovirus-related Pol polyprotein from transposon TNT 1-94 n=1 Tax=Cajanus cajan TaxID=3821 RepID=A0A151SK09_CAJCA|nr:hypothetical protein KK1_001391 [Cajanus cajan]
MATKFNIEKFSGSNDFGLWKVKMEAILIQQGCKKVLKGKVNISPYLTTKKKRKMIDRARSVILCYALRIYKALREVTKERTIVGM